MATIALTNTVVPLTGGAAQYGGQGMEYAVSFSGSFATGDEITLLATDGLTGVQTQFGSGTVTGIVPTFCFTFSQKVYVLATSSAYFSAVDDATKWNDPNGIGNGSVQMSNYYGTTDTLVSIAPYQGKLVFLSRWTVLIWQVDANPNNWQLVQMLSNVGTLASNSVYNLGDLDVLFLSDSGIRSIRVRDNTNNAFVADLGTPIDSLVQASLLANTLTNNSAACSVVEPTSGRYWCYLNGTIYVLSYYPTSKIIAWSTYKPTYETTLIPSASSYPSNKQITYTVTSGATYHWIPGAHEVSLVNGATTLTSETVFTASSTTVTINGTANGASFTGLLTTQTAFVPQKFVVYKGQVFTRDPNNIYAFGGSNNNTYDDCQATIQLPFYDAKRPVTNKQAQGFDADITGTWNLYASPDWIGGSWSTVGTAITKATFDQGWLPYEDIGTHFSLKATSTYVGYASVDSLILHYELADQPAE